MNNPFAKPDPNALQMSEAQMKAIGVQVLDKLHALPLHRKAKLVDAIQNRGGKLVTVAPKGATNAKAEWPMTAYDKRR